MDATDFIIERLVAVRPDDRRFDVTVRIGRPYADNGPHACAVQLEPFDLNPVRIFGEGPMQALHLGLGFIKLRMIAEEDDRGIRFFFPADGTNAEQPIDWRHFWFGDPTRPMTE